MSEVLDQHEFPIGRPPIYPWEIWLDGQIRKLHAGEDFNGQAQSFRVLAHRAAKNIGMRVSTTIVDDGKAIILEAHE